MTSDAIRSGEPGGDCARTEWALRERVKELTCLYGIAQVVERAGGDPDHALEGIVALLPPAWQYPEITGGAHRRGRAHVADAGFRAGGEHADRRRSR